MPSRWGFTSPLPSSTTPGGTGSPCGPFACARAAGTAPSSRPDPARRHDKLEALAEAGAFECFGLDRRGALWQIHGIATPKEPVLPLNGHVSPPRFPLLSGLETVLWDHQATDHSTRGHLLKPLRSALAARGLPTAHQINRMQDGRRVRYAGMVICRQRPGTAKGVTFMTLEDETGFVNLVIWERTFKRYSLPAKTLSCMGVTGKLQVGEGVTHLVVEKIWKPRLDTGAVHARSRDFH